MIGERERKRVNVKENSRCGGIDGEEERYQLQRELERPTDRGRHTVKTKKRKINREGE
jgi:hypothetical protein